MDKDGITFELVNKAEVADWFDDIKDDVTRAAKAGVQSAANIIVEYAQDIAPYKTGTYKRSIHHEEGPESKDSFTRLVGTNIVDPPYPYWLEFGLAGMPAKPTLRPALYNNIDAAQVEISEVIRIMLR